MKYELQLEYTEVGTLVVEAASRSDAIRKWANGEYETDEVECASNCPTDDIINWDLRKIKEIE